MKKLVLLSIAFIGFWVCLTSNVNAQGVGINPSGNNPDPSALLDLSSTTKGALMPRMTTAQRGAISNPAQGLMLYNITTKCFEFYENGGWLTFGCACPVPIAPSAGTSTITETQIVWNWNAVSGATGYKYNTVNDYGTATNNGASISYTPTGLTCSTAYTLYVWAYNGCGNSAATSLIQFTLPCCNSSGIINTIAGTGTAGYTGDGAAATSAQLNVPYGMALDGVGNVYISDFSNNRIRKVTVSTGVISTIAGTGTAGYAGDGIAATSAQLNGPIGIALDASGNVYIADFNNNRIRKVTVSTGLISTIAGTGTGGFSGDGGAATGAQLNQAIGVAFDGSGNVYIADAGNHRIRKVTVSTGLITTIAGTGTAGSSGDGGVATGAQLNFPRGIAFDGSGNVYIGDQNNHRIRKIMVSTGLISTIAGTGTQGFSGDGGAATGAKLSNPQGIALDASGNVYIADASNNRIRKITVSTGLISTIAGTGTNGYNGDGIAATGAQLADPSGVAFDSSGNVYIVDLSNHRIRKICH